MARSGLDRWLDSLAGGGAVVFAKRLAANDTMASGGHQAGPYIPKSVLFRVVREIHQEDRPNPDVWFPLTVVPHGHEQDVRAVWYNNRLFGGTRNETRLTNLGGARSPLLDPGNTGALVLFAFRRTFRGPTCQVWICESREQQSRVQGRLGPVEPGSGIVWDALTGMVSLARPAVGPGRCRLAPEDIPADWIMDFPSGAEIAGKALELMPGNDLPPDERLLTARGLTPSSARAETAARSPT